MTWFFNNKRYLVILSIVGILSFYLGHNKGWWTGFNDGADTMLCVIGHYEDGKEAAMKLDSCQNIKDKQPPLDLFGLQGD